MSLDALRQALVEINGGLIAVDPRHAPSLTSIISELAAGTDVSDARLATLRRPTFEAASQRSVEFVPMVGGGGLAMAIVRASGVAMYGLEFQPYCFSTARLAETITELGHDAKVGRIIIDFNTPGGQVTGTPEAANAVWAARKKKPVVGVVNALCASAGYWIGSQCTKLIGVPSADVGSIGVFMCHYDHSVMLDRVGIKPTFIYAGRHKTEGNSMEPLGEEAKTWLQSEVDGTYREFLSVVARGRSTLPATVKADFGGGRCFPARSALRAGMIDEIALPSEALRSASRFNPMQVSSDRERIAAARSRRIQLMSAGL